MQWVIPQIFAFCMFPHQILFYKPSFQWGWVCSSCSELPAEKTEATQTWQGHVSVIFCFPAWYFQTFYFKSKVGVFFVKTAQLKKKKIQMETFFSILIEWAKTIKFFIQTHPNCTFLLFTTGVNEMRTCHYFQVSYRKKKIYIWQYTLDYV